MAGLTTIQKRTMWRLGTDPTGWHRVLQQIAVALERRGMVERTEAGFHVRLTDKGRKWLKQYK